MLLKWVLLLANVALYWFFLVPVTFGALMPFMDRFRHVFSYWVVALVLYMILHHLAIYAYMRCEQWELNMYAEQREENEELDRLSRQQKREEKQQKCLEAKELKRQQKMLKKSKKCEAEPCKLLSVRPICEHD